MKRLRTIKEKLAVYNKELDEMSKISMSANESRQKKELLLKVCKLSMQIKYSMQIMQIN